MEQDIKVEHKRTDSEGYVTKDIIVLKPEEIYNPFEGMDMHWEGTYEGKTITVDLPFNESPRFAEINNPTSANINQQIIDEMERILRKYN